MIHYSKKHSIFIIQASLFCLIFPTIFATAVDFTGFIPKWSVNNTSDSYMIVKIIESNVTGLSDTEKVFFYHKGTCVLEEFADRNLSFNIKGHTNDGMLVCDIFYNGLDFEKFPPCHHCHEFDPNNPLCTGYQNGGLVDVYNVATGYQNNYTIPVPKVFSWEPPQ